MADIVIPMPDSGNSAALGFSQESGIPMDYGFIRNHYVGRTFIMPEMEQRADSVDMKLAVVPGVVRDKRIVVVDDSIIRGTTSRRRVAALRKAGAKEIHMRISCPPTQHPCFFGIDFPSRKELIAAQHEIEEVREFHRRRQPCLPEPRRIAFDRSIIRAITASAVSPESTRWKRLRPTRRKRWKRSGGRG